MKLKNMGYTALAVSLPDNRSIVLPPRGTTEISQEDFGSSEIQHLYAKRVVIVLPEQGA